MRTSWVQGLDFSSDNPNYEIKNLKWLGLSVIVLVLAICGDVAQAQQARIPKIGWLAVRPASAAYAVKSFQRELSKLGYIEGKNIAFEYREAEGKLDRLPSLADELVRLKVELIIAPNTPAAMAAKNATKTIPFAFIDVTDPIGAGLVDSLPRPGGNVTGFTTIGSVLAGKRLSCSRKPFPSSPVLQCCGIHRTQAPRRVGKKANCQRENWACNFIPWR